MPALPTTLDRNARMGIDVQFTAATMASFNAQMSVELSFDAGVEPLLQPEARGHLLYLAREAISNVLRHAQASSVKIEVARSEDRIVLSVVDDGLGFSMPSRPQRGRGLRNMAERARLVGGRLDVSTRKGRGTRLRVELPSC